MDVLFSGSMGDLFNGNNPQTSFTPTETVLPSERYKYQPEPRASQKQRHITSAWWVLSTFFQRYGHWNKERTDLFLLAFCLFSIISMYNYWRKVSSKRVWKWKMEEKADYAAHRVANQLGDSRRHWPAVFDPVKLSSEAANMNCIVLINGALE